MSPVLDETAKGVFIISATPFEEDGALDLESTDRMVDYYLESGVTGMTILGVMGEAPKLTPDESITFCERVLNRVEGRVPVVVGVSAPALGAIQTLTSNVMNIGASGVMVAPMAGLRTDRQIENYYHDVCETLGDTPIVLQDYPPSSNVYFSVELLNKLFADLPSLKILKHEDSPGLRKISQFRQDEEAGNRRRVSVLVGNGALYLPQELQRGVDGAMTGFAFAEMMVQVCALHSNEKFEEAEDLFDAYLPLVRHEQQIGIGLALRKDVLRRRGIISSATTRKPGPALDSTDAAELSALLVRLNRNLEVLGKETYEFSD
ncbi:MAG: dihydrodipicolinate synthase family protein [Rhodospirillaceae bacterium]|nr:dihydrodipicolinate synthase family protein [Rhodospirillaceae bacterium]|tara:strand:- start:7026 stop:7982 length:957 start_codon:yes stop_codon:yes gene_type:complete